MEPLTLTIGRVATDPVDIAELASVAALTFPLACPPTATPENIATFVDVNLSPARFGEYLGDPDRAIVAARRNGRIVGYAMVVRGVSDDAGVQQAVEIRPAAELSKLYLLPDYHGSTASAALMDAALAIAADWGVRCMWLGVSKANQRAQRFYAKSGFNINGTRTFRVGAHLENDYVMIREVG
ncbi:GNAT family N-acetyltransferase [Mycobacterium montefiorense]|uniref:N-acetyltransferase n=1 Tax=Mycobacterium montefiorense TaxID=154654 RepID=A0AA37PTV0_9MYCO|nr:GNAT family N-acetyltransferase [Mycobacterium montefiorense]GBG38167.1 N-acetyltransferase [Mycobacterium montefiorense]GKU37636.1 N-acetyltransferase [Mycobacterium montefiorense]GKU41330.1 N-acetyltransferase [Mycobacterium montefiorense]GKU44448.1 N-acetyltransferase [Mycobacterium montefiorense]GKU52536.1 N-acetyltransferase [Mycobacterium montefiorense]